MIPSTPRSAASLLGLSALLALSAYPLHSQARDYRPERPFGTRREKAV